MDGGSNNCQNGRCITVMFATVVVTVDLRNVTF